MTIGREIEKNILRILRNAENPVSTRDLALKIGRAWHSVQHHCFRLQIAGKVHGFQVGRMNLWQINPADKNNKKTRQDKESGSNEKDSKSKEQNQKKEYDDEY